MTSRDVHGTTPHWGWTMPKYAAFFTYTEESWAKMIANPTDREAAIRASAQAVGADVECVYYMLGGTDGFVIFDAPDTTTIAAISVAVSSSGAARSVGTHELIAPSDMPAVLAKAAEVQGSYRTPGS
ncbi:GYD domain-containing protein [Actinomycetospora flava]|uniref:GYD domain-containing protein n=1 Tax=Actinomycetospora flava TaxID=3129232 RepID=A0ABU8MF86_9PSEU